MDDVVKAGKAAERLLDSDVFQQAVDQADERYVSEWRLAETTEERERTHAKQAALRDVIRELETIRDAGLLQEAAQPDE